MTWYSKGYIVYQNSEGNQYTVYSSMVSGSYQTISSGENYYNVLVENGSITNATKNPNSEGNYPIGTILTIKADQAASDQFFSHWIMDDSKIVSHQETYVFSVQKNVHLKAIYTEKSEEIKPAIEITSKDAFIEDGVIKVSFSATRNTPDSCSLISQGIIVTKNENIGKNVDLFQIGGQDVLKAGQSNSQNNGIYTLTLKNAGENTVWYARGYLTYQDVEGNQFTIYSTIDSISYLKN